VKRRNFLLNVAAGASARSLKRSQAKEPPTRTSKDRAAASPLSLEGYTLQSEFQLGSESWKVYEDLRARDGSIIFVSSAGVQRVLEKTAEATFADADPPYFGLKLSDIGTAGADLLADKLLKNGEPDPLEVKSAAPPAGSALRNPANPGFRLPWNTFVGTVECFDTMPVYPNGNTRTYHPVQYFPELTAELARKRYEGLVGGWMPAVRKVMPVSETSYFELIIFGDVEARDRFIVQTWHRTAHIENGKINKVVYGWSYPAFRPSRTDPAPADFYRALLAFASYWEKHTVDIAVAKLPEQSWVDMSRHAFAKELMVRPGGFYPKYGAVDRDYYGAEYDGFQDIFTSAVYTNLEWGRFDQAKRTIDNYFSDFVDSKGAINMRGPETAQFGLTLSLLARYYHYTRDRALLLKHAGKIAASAEMLVTMHDESLKAPKDDPGYGLIRGWSESDACLASKPSTWWQPYFANSAFSARGLKDIAVIWPMLHRSPSGGKQAQEWSARAETLKLATNAALEKNVRREMTPPYIGPYPGAKLTFRESMEKEQPSPQQWPHRAYAELLQADILSPESANIVIDCMRAYGATTLGVVANVGRARPNGRAILGFISYGYAQMLLRLDRIHEYLLFLYSHRYHDHTRGSWTAGEVSGIGGGTAIFCIPAQQTIPLLVRWMLVFEDSDQEHLHFGKAIPSSWVVSGKEISIHQAPTRWGRVNFRVKANPQSKQVVAHVELPDGNVPRELHVRTRLPRDTQLTSVTVNSRESAITGNNRDTVVIAPGAKRVFEIDARWV
jgi:hypothetical protein